VEPLQQRVATKEKTISAPVDELNAMKSANAELATRIEAERKHTHEKLELVKNAEKQMIHQFESLGAKILEEKGKEFTEQNKLNLDRVLLPLREQLGDFREKVDDVHVEDIRDRAALREAICTLNQQNQRITEEASNLVWH
jgi:DNA recombination protein RmuC